MRWIARRARARAREDVVDSVGQRVEAERLDAEEALGNNQEFFAQDFQLQFCLRNPVTKYAAAVLSKTRFFSRW